MKNLFFVIIAGLLATACVSHDTDEVVVESEEPILWQQAPAPQPVVVEHRPVVVQAEPQQKSTWWQQNKQKHTIKVVVPECPCKDPNDPCTHCYQK